MYFNELVAAYDRQRRERNIYHDLMRFHVREVLLVGSLYDSFVVESDGVLTEQIYGEYFKLNLSTVPRVNSAYTAEAAIDLFREGRYDLVIIMAGVEFDQPLTLASAMKSIWPDIPVLLLATNNASLANLDPAKPELAAVDRVFVWNGYSKLFVAMIKYVEDLRNVDTDTRAGQVRVILLIEDSIRYYSRYLPVLYKVVLRQTQALIEEEKATETYKLLSIRARPKILLASSYEEASRLFEKYEPFILTVITDLKFPHKNGCDEDAGFEFLSMARTRLPDLPLMVQSSETGVRERAYAMGASYIDKNSESLEMELRTYFQNNLGFGTFTFRDPAGHEIAQARNMEEFVSKLHDLPPESLVYHAEHNHFSSWLMAHGEIQMAGILRNYKVDDFSSVKEVRDFIVKIMDSARRGRARGMVPGFDENLARDVGSLSRLGDGSVGGKGRGIVFIKSLLENLDFGRYIPDLAIKIPRTAFIGIDEFERFLESNSLWSSAFYGQPGEDFRRRFLAAPLPPALVQRLRRMLAVTDHPLAVRSSGLFEDMLMVPFSGIYDTYIIPNSDPDPEVRLSQLCDAVRLIYMSLFSSESRAYFDIARYNLEEERMAIIVQELVGSRRGRWFYPHISGTAQSFNYYPVSYLKPEDGLCVAALGLGSYVVEGGVAHRFCPKYPKLDVLSPEQVLQTSQRVFRALDMEMARPDLSAGEDATLAELPISEAEADPHFHSLVSTWDIEDARFVPGVRARGPRILDFADILKHESIPFARAIDMVLDIGSRSMGVPVEIEYALNLDEPEGKPALYLLQIKPLIHAEDRIEVELAGIENGACFIKSERSMGNGRITGLRDVVWVDPSKWDRSKTLEIAAEIEEMDRKFRGTGKHYLLVGPGRWGTRDRWLGVPVSFSQISRSRVIVEADLPDFSVESSLGSHFFHNVTSMNIGYLTVSSSSPGSFVDWNWIACQPVAARTEHCVWTSLDAPLDIRMDGRTGIAAVMKPTGR
ncbi:MAG: PEP/pyruvate-binding domain-containing protein [Rectinemataceae bacterium]